MSTSKFPLFLLIVFTLAISSLSFARDNEDGRDIKHVLLISVDGMHALDLTNYIAAHPGSTLAQLSGHGITYTNASTPYVSDSFPGLAALITGGSPTTTGLWYDVSFNRKLSPPAQTTGTGILGGANLCPGTVGAALGYDEGVDFDLSRLDAGGGINRRFCLAIPTMPASLSFRTSTYALIQSSMLRGKPASTPPGSTSTRRMNGSTGRAIMVRMTSLDRKSTLRSFP